MEALQWYKGSLLQFENYFMEVDYIETGMLGGGLLLMSGWVEKVGNGEGWKLEIIGIRHMGT